VSRERTRPSPGPTAGGRVPTGGNRPDTFRVVILAATLTDACGSDPGAICEWVFDTTENETLAEVADWLVHTPMRIALILLVAFVVNRVVRRALLRFVERVSQERSESINAERSESINAERSESINAERSESINAERSESAAPGRFDRQWLETLRERDVRSRQRALTMAAVLRNVASVIVYTMAVLLCLGELDVNLGPLIAGAGIVGVALGFGAQSMVRDFLAGIFIVLEDQYGVGDTVNLGDASGSVEKVTLRTTWLRDLDGTLWVVPNGEIRRVANRSQRWARAVLDVRVGADADLERAIDVARQATLASYGSDRSGAMLAEPKVLGVESFLDGAAVLRVTVRTRPGAQYDVARRLRVALRRAFDEAGIAMTDAPRN
jgi:small-conductance mechanosensitive channel